MLFVQIGDQAFDPKGATIQFLLDGLGEIYASLTAANGITLMFSNEDYDAFMDWWINCADVSRFPRKNRLEKAKVQQ